MPDVVKIIENKGLKGYGEERYGEEGTEEAWCLVFDSAGDEATLCGGIYFQHHNSGVTKYERKEGRITCDRCRDMIKSIKKISLR